MRAAEAATMKTFRYASTVGCVSSA